MNSGEKGKHSDANVPKSSEVSHPNSSEQTTPYFLVVPASQQPQLLLYVCSSPPASDVSTRPCIAQQQAESSGPEASQVHTSPDSASVSVLTNTICIDDNTLTKASPTNKTPPPASQMAAWRNNPAAGIKRKHNAVEETDEEVTAATASQNRGITVKDLAILEELVKKLDQRVQTIEGKIGPYIKILGEEIRSYLFAQKHLRIARTELSETRREEQNRYVLNSDYVTGHVTGIRQDLSSTQQELSSFKKEMQERDTAYVQALQKICQSLLQMRSPSSSVTYGTSNLLELDIPSSSEPYHATRQSPIGHLVEHLDSSNTMTKTINDRPVVLIQLPLSNSGSMSEGNGCSDVDNNTSIKNEQLGYQGHAWPGYTTRAVYQEGDCCYPDFGDILDDLLKSSSLCNAGPSTRGPSERGSSSEMDRNLQTPRPTLWSINDSASRTGPKTGEALIAEASLEEAGCSYNSVYNPMLGQGPVSLPMHCQQHAHPPPPYSGAHTLVFNPSSPSSSSGTHPYLSQEISVGDHTLVTSTEEPNYVDIELHQQPTQLKQRSQTTPLVHYPSSSSSNYYDDRNNSCASNNLFSFFSKLEPCDISPDGMHASQQTSTFPQQNP